jgi:hypothetical protein
MPFRSARRAAHRLPGLAATGAALLILVATVPFVSAAPAATNGIDVRLPLGHQIRGTLTAPDGDPIAGAEVFASSDTDSRSGRTGADGTYIVHGLVDGSYRIFAEDAEGTFAARYYGVPESVADGTDATLVEVAGAAVTGIDIQLGLKPPTGISGTIRDPEGAPVAGVYVAARGDTDFGDTRSAVDGTYRIAGLSAGDYTLFVEPPADSPLYGGDFANGTIATPDDEPTLITVTDLDATGVDVALPRGRTITGHLTMARPATIVAFAEGPRSGEAIVDNAGNYRIQGLPPAEYQVSFRDAVPGPEQTEIGTFPYGSYGTGGTLVSQIEAATIDLTESNATLHSVFLPRGTDLLGKVTDGKNGLPNAFLFVCDQAGQTGCASTFGGADGTFRIVHVPTGQYTIFVSVPGRVAGFYRPEGFTIDDFGATAVPVVSGHADVKGIKVAVPIGGSVNGRITGPSGEAVVGARVTAFPLGIPMNWLQPLTRSDGRYTQTGLPTNQYGMSVQAPEGSDYLSGYFLAGAPGHYGTDFEQATTFRVIELNDRDAPFVTFRQPVAGATDVQIDQEVSVRFSEPIENATATSVVLRDPRGRVVPATVTIVPVDRTIRLMPNDRLQPGTKYRLTLTSAIVDWSGNHFAGANWTFTTSP